MIIYDASQKTVELKFEEKWHCVRARVGRKYLFPSEGLDGCGRDFKAAAFRAGRLRHDGCDTKCGVLLVGMVEQPLKNLEGRDIVSAWQS